MTIASQRSNYLDRPSSSGLVDVVDLILDKGLVIDIYVRVSLVGIELLTIDARIVVASVDTYLRFAERVNRLDLARSGTETRGLPGVMEEIHEGGAEHKTKGVLEGVKEKVGDVLGSDEDEDTGRGDHEQEEEDDGGEEQRREERPRQREERSRQREERPRRGSRTVRSSRREREQ
ncbi:gas vesicle protein GvpJ [Streptomyces sp. 8N616]|uniref:gas vesicle protein GvpJ n=1 Tax=Streptomyces sp. 8N616 TaxID=3457414 RepID=UPI003FD5F0A0